MGRSKELFMQTREGQEDISQYFQWLNNQLIIETMKEKVVRDQQWWQNYRDAHRAIIKENHRLWRLRNKEKISMRNKEYRETHKLKSNGNLQEV
jgi:hypothetical protein